MSSLIIKQYDDSFLSLQNGVSDFLHWTIEAFLTTALLCI